MNQGATRLPSPLLRRSESLLLLRTHCTRALLFSVDSHLSSNLLCVRQMLFQGRQSCSEPKPSLPDPYRSVLLCGTPQHRFRDLLPCPGCKLCRSQNLASTAASCSCAYPSRSG